MSDKPTPKPTQPDKQTLENTQLTDKSEAEIRAALACDPLFRSLSTTATCGSAAGKIGMVESMEVLRKTIDKVNSGNLRHVENTLVVQANTLDALFNELARRALIEGQHLAATESYLALALKTQSQCRATLQTLVNIKRPTTVIAQQANVSTGMQQVNNHLHTGKHSSTDTKHAKSAKQTIGARED